MGYTQFKGFDDLSEDSIMDAIAKVLRKNFNTPVNYGYDALADLYFFDVPNHSGAYIEFLGKFLRNRRWDILHRVIELLEESVLKNREKEKINAGSIN